MESDEWAVSTDPLAMLDFLRARELDGALWLFTLRCCQRVEGRLPGNAFRKVLSLAKDLGSGLATWEMVDEAVAEAAIRLDKLTVKYQGMDEGEEYERLGKQLDAAQVVFVFDNQGSYEAAHAASQYFTERAEDRAVEARSQSDLLREIVPDPLSALSDELDQE